MKNSLFREFSRAGGGFIVNRLMIRALGAELSVFVADLADRDAFRNSSDGWFYATKEQRMADLGMTEGMVIRLMKEAGVLGIVQTQMRGVPAKQYIKVDYDKIQQILEGCIASAEKPEPPSASLGQTPEASLGHSSEALLLKERLEETNTKEEPEKQKEVITRSSRTLPTLPPEPIKLQDIVNLWNKEMPSPIPRVSKLTDQRRTHLKARLADLPTMEGWIDLFKMIRRSSFLCGKSSEWYLDFDWVIANDTNLTKVLEGKYDDKEKSLQSKQCAKPGTPAALSDLSAFDKIKIERF